MEAKDVIAFREQFDRATFTRYNRLTGEKREFKPGIHICCDNSLNAYDDRMGSVIWDDENERFYWFRLNGPTASINSPTSAMSMGDKVQTPALVICVDYGEIQNLRVILDEEMILKYFDALGDLINDDEKAHIMEMIFDETDMSNIILRKKNVSYVTGMDKRADISSKHHSDLDEYNRTVHTN